ncbi:MAG TPA: DUF2252 domain-containing protein [Streptosporangiaceae bacterium]|nr:DUF2252 domain-containing protein [Streptosporangiaceae bacterium]
MTVTDDGVVAGGSAARVSGRGPARAAAVEQLSRADRVARGKDARAAAPLESHAEFTPAPGRDPVGLLVEQEKTRVPELVPVRHGRMLVSAFTFYRGAALPMAADLATTPTSGLRVQLCGDAHLSNFGAFASPERNLVFDVNDFDETLPGPFEWDVKRLAASLTVAGRDNGFPAKACRKITLAAGEGYRTAMRGFADQTFMDVWYTHVDIQSALAKFQSQVKAKRYKLAQKQLAKAHTSDTMKAVGKLTTVVDGQRRIISQPPLIVPVEELFADVQADAIYQLLHTVLNKYRRTLQSDRRHLLEQFAMVQAARKVVGVGSVGTRAYVLLMDAGDGVEPLFLQAKEAQASVLAEYAGRSQYTNQGERAVAGQHLMQAESDIFLGWTRVPNPIDGIDRDFYVRQLKDWKFSVPIEIMLPQGLEMYARLCGATLARAHARSGDRIALAAYLGGSDKFDQAIADFAETYADQNERDYAALKTAAKEGKVEVSTEI